MKKFLSGFVIVVIIFIIIMSFIIIAAVVLTAKILCFFFLFAVVNLFSYFVIRRGKIKSPKYLKFPSLLEFLIIWILYIYINPYLINYILTDFIFPKGIHVSFNTYKFIQYITDPITCFLFLSTFIIEVKSGYLRAVRNRLDKKDVYILDPGLYLIIGNWFIYETSGPLLGVEEDGMFTIYDVDEYGSRDERLFKINLDSNNFIKTVDYTPVQQLGYQLLEKMFSSFSSKNSYILFLSFILSVVICFISFTILRHVDIPIQINN